MEKNEKDRADVLSTGQHNPIMSLPRLSKGANILYFDIQQRQLFINPSLRKRIVEGGAGAGKTLLCLLKSIEITRSDDSNDNVMIFAPFPHTLRCTRFLKANGVDVLNESEFPPVLERHSKSVVYVYDLDQVLNVCPVNVSSMKPHHIFFDDAQSVFRKADADDFEKWKRVQSLFADLHQHSKNNKRLYAWFCLDKFQTCPNSGVLPWMTINKDMDGKSLGINGLPKVFKLDSIMRNAAPIIKHMLVDVQLLSTVHDQEEENHYSVGHSINGPGIEYHVLIYPGHIQSCLPTVGNYMSSTLSKLLKMYPTIDIAVLYDDDDFTESSSWSNVIKSLDEKVLSIQESIESDNTNCRKVIVDKAINVASFECPIVIVICSDPGCPNLEDVAKIYTLTSRGRSKLIVVPLVQADSYFGLNIEYIKVLHPQVVFNVTTL